MDTTNVYAIFDLSRPQHPVARIRAKFLLDAAHLFCKERGLPIGKISWWSDRFYVGLERFEIKRETY